MADWGNKYDEIEFDNKAKIFIVKKGGKVGIVDKYGKEIVPCENDSYYEYYGQYKFEKNGKMGLYSPSDHAVVPADYDYVTGSGFSAKDGHSLLHNNKKIGEEIVYKYGMYDLVNGREIIPCEYNKITAFFNDYKVVNNGKVGILSSKNGKEILPLEYDKINTLLFINRDDISKPLLRNDVNEQWLKVEKNGKMGILDLKTKNMVFPFIYDAGHNSLDFLSENLLCVCKKGKVGVVDITTKEIVVPFIYDNIEFMSDDLSKFAVSKDGKCGVLDTKTLKENVLCEYDDIGRRAAYLTVPKEKYKPAKTIPVTIAKKGNKWFCIELENGSVIDTVENYVAKGGDLRILHWSMKEENYLIESIPFAYWAMRISKFGIDKDYDFRWTKYEYDRENVALSDEYYESIRRKLNSEISERVKSKASDIKSEEVAIENSKKIKDYADGKIKLKDIDWQVFANDISVVEILEIAHAKARANFDELCAKKGWTDESNIPDKVVKSYDEKLEEITNEIEKKRFNVNTKKLPKQLLKEAKREYKQEERE